jgi:hypothetical protein
MLWAVVSADHPSEKINPYTENILSLALPMLPVCQKTFEQRQPR